MAKQDGIIPLKGAIDKIAFVKRKSGGYGAQKKTSIDPKKLATAIEFENTRQNGREFGRAGSAGKLIRRAFVDVMLQTSDKQVTGRLVKEIMKVVKSDLTSERGERKLTDGDISKLKNFEFNEGSSLTTIFKQEFTATIDRAAGTLKLGIAGFVPLDKVSAPPGTTHFSLVSAGAEFDFENKKYVVDKQSVAAIPWTDELHAPIELINTVTPGSQRLLLLVLGIVFHQQVGGKMGFLRDKSYNSLVLVEASLP